MDPNSSLGKICLGDNVIEISSDKIKGLGDWNSPEYQDTASTYDGEVNLGFDENLISNEFAVKLCLDYEMKKGKKFVKKELIVALKGEFYFVKFIINLEEDDFEAGVILGRSFLRLAKGIVDFGNGVITIYPEPNLFEDDFEKTGKSLDDWDQLLDFNFDDVPKFGEELPLFVCKMGKSSCNKKRAIENLNLFYQDIGPYSSVGGHLTQEEAKKEALAIKISQKFALLEEENPVIETMAYHDKYKKILIEIWKDKVELDGKTMKEDEEAVKRIKGEALNEKDDPGAFIFPIRLKGKVNENALADTGSDINTMPYQIYETLGREEMKKIDRVITMINHTQAKAMGKLSNVLCQVGVTTIIAKFLILDIPIDRDAPIVVGRGFLYTMGSILNTPKRLFSTFDGVCHQTFRAARFDVLRTAESDSDDEEEYVIKRNKFGAPIYGSNPVSYLNRTNPEDRSSAIQTTQGTHDNEVGSSRSKRPRQHETVEELLLPQVHHEFLLWKGCSREAKSRYNTKLAQLLHKHIYSPCVVNWDVLNRIGCDGEINDMLRIRLREAGSDEEIFTSVAWIRAFNINEPIYAELCHEFYSTYEFDEVCDDDELQSKKIIKFRLGGRVHNLTLLEFARRLGLYQAVELEEDGFNVYFEGGLRNDDNFNAQDYWLSISREDNHGLSRSHTSTIRNPILRVIHKMITYGLCQRTTGYDKVQKNDLWLLSMFDARHQNGYANVAWVIARWVKRKGARTQKESQICCGQFISKLARKCKVLTEDVVRRLSASIYCRDLDTTTLRDLIDSDGKLIPEDPQPGVPRVGIPRPPRASMQDLYDRMGRMEICQDAIERMEYRQSYHWDRYHGVFEHMAGDSVPLQGAYNPPGYAQPQYDQYYQQYPPPPPQHQQDDDE
ncbi:ribonuclease H-like domain-containing protein [Tanacetum coccineum]